MMSAVFSPDNKFILSSSADGLARVWDLNTGQAIFKLSLSDREKEFAPKTSRAPRGDVTEMGDFNTRNWSIASYSPDAERILTADNKSVRVWDAKTGNKLTTLRDDGFQINGAAFSRNGNYIVTTNINNTARVWETKTGTLMVELHGHRDVIRSAEFDPDSKRLLTASADRTARIWEFGMGNLKTTLKVPKRSFSELSYSPNGQLIMGLDSELAGHMFDAKTGRHLAQLDTGEFPIIRSAIFSADSRRIFGLGVGASAWDALTGKKIFDFEGGSFEALREWGDLTASPDGALVVATARDYVSVLRWDAKTGKKISQLSTTDGAATLSFSPNGKYLVTNSTVRNARTGQPIKTWTSSVKIFLLRVSVLTTRK